MITEKEIRKMHAVGRANRDNFCFCDEYGVLEAAFDAGQSGYELGKVVDCVRYGNLPESGRSFNYSDGKAEAGVSVISAGGDTKGSAGASMFMSDRKVVKFRGIEILGVRGSDGEPLVLPVDFYRHF